MVEPLDRESASLRSTTGDASFHLTVLGRDNGVPPLSASTTVTIYVDDINDNPPRFEREIYDVTISEATPRGTPVVTILATDADSSNNTQLRYSLVNTAQGKNLITSLFSN